MRWVAMQGQHRNLKEKLIRSKQDNSELREEVDSLSRLKDRVRTLELQLKASTQCMSLGSCRYSCLCEYCAGSTLLWQSRCMYEWQSMH